MEKLVKDRDRVKDHVDTKIRETTEVLGQRIALEADETNSTLKKNQMSRGKTRKKRQSLNLQTQE